MTLTKDYSIAADSTLSASSPIVVKRATHTYGRRKTTNDDEHTTDVDDHECGSAPRQSIYRTAPPGVIEEIPPSSSAGDDDEHPEGGSATPKFRFEWQKKLWQIDHPDEDMGEDMPVEPLLFAGGNSSDDTKQDDFDGCLSPPKHDASPSPASRSGEQVPEPSSSSLPSLSSPASQHLSDSPLFKKRSAKIPDVNIQKGNTPSSPTSPAFPHRINTPNSCSSPTSPTSDGDEDSNKPSTRALKQKKVKGKSILPLRFGSPPCLSLTTDVTKVHATKTKAKTRDNKGKKRRAPTKKDIAEATKDRSRIAAVQRVSLPRAAEENKYTMKNFFVIVNPVQQPPSDPIQPFSSSPRAASIATSLAQGASEELSEPPHATSPPKVRAVSVPLPALDSDSDSDLPEMSHILKQRKEVERAQELANLKRRALVEQTARRKLGAMEDSDDDLEVVDNMQVVAAEEAGQRRAMKAKHVKHSEGRRRQLLLGGVRHHTADLGRPSTDSLEQLMAFSGPSFIASPGGKYGKRREEKRQLNQGSLNKMLTQRISQENAEMIRKKEEEWVKKGGRPGVPLHPEDPGPKALQDTWKTYAERGIRIAEKKERTEVEEADESDGSDEDWIPEVRGSASPRQEDDGDAHCEEEVDGAVSEGMSATNGEVEDDADEEMEETEAVRPRAPRGVLSRSRVIVDSDDDDDRDENGRILVPGSSFTDVDIVARQLPVISHRRSTSSLEDRTEDDTDKENNTRLMYDRSEDKENKAVVRHSPLTGVSAFRGRSLFSLADGIERSRSVSPRADLSHINGPSGKEETARSPLKELSKHAEDPFASPGETPTSIATRVQHDSPIAPQPTFTPKILSFDKCDIGFSQFLDDGDQDDENSPVVALAPALQPGFSQLFESGSLGPSAPLKSAAPLDNDESPPALNNLRMSGNLDELSLTLDVRLQPALEVSEKLRRQADSVFEKEQGYLLEAARRVPKQKQELYVNDHGFLTQTRPDGSSPEIYRLASPSQPTEFLMTQGRQEATIPDSTPRRPLRTLSLLGDQDTPDYAPRGRLRRRGSPITDISRQSSPSSHPSDKKLNAFDVLTHNARSKVKESKTSVKLGASEFVEAEAQESDDDEMRGFGISTKKDDEEEEDGEDLDKTLDVLVDDTEMDEETQAKDLVLEKVKEHHEEDDRVLEKLHRDAAEGKLRTKRRDRGPELDDSGSEEDEDDHARIIRMKMHKKRRIDGDNLEALGKNDETRPFYNTYHKDLVDDDPLDFIHLRKDVVMASDEEEEEEPAQVSTTEILQQARDLARTAESSEVMDPHDVSWIDSEIAEHEGDTRVCVKDSTSKPKKQQPRPALGQVDFDSNLERPKRTHETDQEKERLQSWYRVENKSRNSGTGRVTIGAAVTGHGKSNTGGSSLRSAQPVGASSGTARPVEQRKQSKGRSILAGIADRTRRFA